MCHGWIRADDSFDGFFPSEAIGVPTSSVGGVARLRFGAGMLVPLQGAA
jgi:hypothetical protein